MKIEPTREHRWLQQLVGAWRYDSTCSMGPGQPPFKGEGTELVRPLGELWIIADGKGDMPGGGTATTMLTLGFDPQSQRFKGAWIGSMMAMMWHYDGALDLDNRCLTLASKGPSMAGDGSIGEYEDIVEIVNADHRVFSSRTRMPDGTWNAFMETHYRRVSGA